MSAIWGSINFNFSPLNNSYIHAMESPYKQYKIDRFENKCKKNVVMGCCLQYITKESYYETLPIFYNDIYYITADCVLDNRTELIAELNIKNIDTPDGTLILEAYKKWGVDCASHLRGFFSYAIYDSLQNKLILATDQVSSRCLYYFIKDNQCYFSTLLKPILSVNSNTIPINEQFIYDALSINGLRLGLDSTSTPYKDVFKIEAGTYIIITPDSVEKKIYWTPFSHKNKISYATKEEYGEHFKRLIKTCITSALRTNQNVGVSLSSGLDSSTIGSIAASILQKDNKTLYSYTFVPANDYKFDGEKYYLFDESAGVHLICNQYPNIKPTFLSNDIKGTYSELDNLLNLLELPIKSIQNTPMVNAVFNQAEKDGCRVVLNGHFGNISFSQGHIEDAIYSTLCSNHFINAFKTLNHFCNKNNIYKKPFGLHLLKSYSLYPFKRLGYHLNNNLVINTYVNKKMLNIRKMNKKLKKNKLNTTYKIFHTIDTYRKALFDTCSMAYTGELDTKLGLANGLLIRDPSKDIRILEFCADIPMECFVNQDRERWLIRANMHDYVPSPILTNTCFRGLQNADWRFRVNKQWKKIKEDLKTNCTSSHIEKYVDIAKIMEFFSENTEQIAKENEEEAGCIFFIASLNKWLEKEKKISF